MKYSASYVINLGTCLIWEHSVNIEELKSAKLKMDILKAGFVSPVRLQDIHPWGSMVGAQLRRKPANYTGRLSWNNVNKLLIEVNYHFHIYVNQNIFAFFDILDMLPGSWPRYQQS